jgi:uncharacterized membrane protein YfcA
MSWLLYMGIGLASGIISGMGIGGGAVLIPALTILFAMNQLEAQHINLLYFLPTAAIALVTHRKKGNIEKKGLLRLTLFGLLGAAAGAVFASRVDAGLLGKGFGIFLLGMGAYELFRKETPYSKGESSRSVS